MKYKILLSIVVLITAAMLLNINPEVHGSTNGAPTIVTGSPGDGNNTCAKSGCHTDQGAAMASPGWITSTIPASGYAHGVTYTVTATATMASHVKFGFEISPQTPSGVLVGTLVAGTGTQVLGGGKYITHTGAGTVGTTGSHTWTFSWTAPATGTTPFTFYGAFNCTNNNAMKTGDVIHTSTLAVTAAGAGIDEMVNKPIVTVFPNPINDAVTVKYTLAQASAVSIKMFDIAGREIVELVSEKEKSAGTYSSTFDMSAYSSGIYFMMVSAGDAVSTERVVVVR